jgi:hypothetical protein
MFSISALIISKLRNRLSKTTFQWLISLKSWGLFIEELIEDEEILKEKEKIKEIGEDNPYIFKAPLIIEE